MKKAFAIIVTGLLCVSTFPILTPKVMGWAFGLHGAMANDALSGMGWSNQVGTYANDVDLYFPHPGSSNHRVGKYQVLYQNLGGDPCNYQGAEYWARIYIASARNSYVSNNVADAEMYLGYAIHYIEDAVCPPHVFPFSEEFIWWAPLSWQLVSLETAPHANFEAETLVGYGIKNWPSLVRNAEPALIADPSDLETKIVQAADRVYALPCDYVRQNDYPTADDNDVVGDPSHVTGWSTSDENIGKCMVEAASLVKGAAIYVGVGAAVVPPEVVCVPFHGMLPGVPHDAWIGKEIILKGTAHDPDGDSTLAAYKWDFGDGYSTNWIAGVNAYVIEARHTYTGTMADGTPYDAGKYFTAWLHVKDNDGLEGKDSYFIAIREKTLDVEVNVAIDNGLWWLHKQQSRGAYGDGVEYGYWPSSYGFNVAFAGASTEAFELQGHLPSGDRNEDPYVETVQRGLNYLFSNCGTYSIGQDPTYCPFGNPDTNGNGIGLACTTYSGEILYEAGIALMAISSSGTPDRVAATGSPNVVGRTYKDIAQDMVDWIAWGQSDPYTGVYEGGWRYTANYGASDNSVSQWPVIGMEAAERNFGSAMTIPSFVRPELAKWLSYSQNPSGGFGYTTPWEWVNTAKTGAGCAMLSWAGVPTTDARFQNALAFLDANWYYSGYTYTNFGDYYTMYAIMKGMRIPNPNIESIGSHDWYAEYARYIIDQQNSCGGEYVVDQSWLSSYVGGTLATAWAIATLTPTLVKPGPVADAGSDVSNFPPTIPVKFDASGSYHRDPTKSIVLYEWDFDSDGTRDYSGTNVKVEHAYPAYYNPDGSIDWDKTAKDYTATLRVSDNSDPVLQDTDTCIIHITAPPWKPVADPDGPYEGSIGVPVQFDGSKSYDPESKMYSPSHPWYETIAKYEWDLDNDGLFDDSLDAKPSYTWDTKGTYSIGLRVTDSQPSGPGGTIGPLDTDTKYTTVVIKEAPPKTVTVTIIEVRSIDTMDPIGPLSAADFYAKVSIDGFSLPDSSVRSNDNEIYPRWSFSRLVSKTKVSIHIEIWDSDWPLSDDHVDINKDPNHRDLNLFFDTTTESITGDVTYGYSKGGGGDGNRAEMWFNVGLDNGDKDGDGLFDSWETAGIHMNDDGVVDLNLPALGATPNHKDLFIEIDWMADVTHSHRPMAGVSQAVINAFANAPVTNPDATSGINLHIDESTSVPHQDFLDLLNVWNGFDAIKSSNFDMNRRFVYHYCLFAHELTPLMSGTSGIAELPGNDFIVSLGNPGWGGIGTFQQQAGTLMHEFGHNLDLGHGGGDHVNYKPNYLSIMNYFFQMSGVLPTGRLDYSRSALPNLDENGLNENLGIQDGTDNTNYYSPTGLILVGTGTGSIDWDADGVIETNVQADINRDGTYLGPIHIPSRTVLTGYNDWSNIMYSALGTSDFEDGVHLTPELLVELDVSTYNRLTDHLAPTTTMLIGTPKYVSDKTYVTPDTPFTLEATDTDSGVFMTSYQTSNATYYSGWQIYTTPFCLTSLADSAYTIEYNSTDNAGNVETTHAVNVTLFSWSCVFEDTLGRGTTLKVNIEHGLFQFVAPDVDYGLRNATHMFTHGNVIRINHDDGQLRIIAVAVGGRLDICIASVYDQRTDNRYLLVDKAGVEVPHRHGTAVLI